MPSVSATGFHQAAFAGAAAGLLLTCGAARAGDGDGIPALDRAQVAVGAYGSSNGLSGRWDSSTGEHGTDFDFQRHLGFDPDQRTWFWSAGFAAGAARQFRFDAFGHRHSADSIRTLDQDLLIDGELFPAAARFDGGLQVSIQGASFTWFFHRTAASALGLGLGAVEYGVESDLVASVSAPGAGRTVSKRIDQDVVAPLLRGEYVRVLGPRWRAGVALAWIGYGSGNTTGHVVDAHARLEYFPIANAGISLRYAYNVVDVELERASYDGTVRLERQGPQLLATFRF